MLLPTLGFCFLAAMLAVRREMLAVGREMLAVRQELRAPRDGESCFG